MTRNEVSMAVIGGGIGGLAAGLSLLRAGVDVHVYEQSRGLSEVGAGIQVSPNASRVLHRLGLAEALAMSGVKPVAWHQRRWDDGRTLLRTPLGEDIEAAFGFPHYQIHRADLLDALAGAFPAERFHAGHRLTRLAEHEDHVEAEFESGTHIGVDALVGADGIHSTVRCSRFGPDIPHYTGCVAYRGLVPADRLAHLDLEVTAQIWMGPGKHFVHYFVQNRRLLNFIAVIEQDSWTRESWTDQGEVADALAAFAGWHPQIRGILEGVDKTFLWALFDRKPLARWSVGRVTLLGDACHAMLPFMAQGAAQAIEDGATLAVCLSKVDARDVPDALRRYETLRQPRASRIQALSAKNKTRFHLPDGPDQEERDAELARGTTDWSSSAWLYGHDAGVIEPASWCGAGE
ncbi:FAD-dependent monooxygenase [Accumulibacter sp.]|uniref:FAD-dependent monooxygenase n=1 Tax=Accumulibacter sp. TaxID=2053492 RepID=UPI0028C3A7F7|nr:FAD-dependent monooxygenase [Accumulibacter sp.]